MSAIWGWVTPAAFSLAKSLRISSSQSPDFFANPLPLMFEIERKRLPGPAEEHQRVRLVRRVDKVVRPNRERLFCCRKSAVEILLEQTDESD